MGQDGNTKKKRNLRHCACSRGFSRRQVVTNQQCAAALIATGVAAGMAAVWRGRERYSFENRSVLITGGSRGLGLEMARLLVEEGAAVAIAARDESELARAAAQLG